MLGEIIAIGNELTSGRIVNTTSGFAAHHLYEAGFNIYAMHTIGDSPELIGEALNRALKRVDFVLVTGGLGPTDDDLTTEAVSEALNRPTMPDLTILSRIREHLNSHTEQSAGSLEKLAWLPEGAEALHPGSKIAGFQLVHDDKPIFFLPGIPHQMKSLLLKEVLPRLNSCYKGYQLSNVQRIYKIFGRNEAEINREVKGLALDDLVEIGYYPVFPDVHLSVTIRSEDKRAMNELAQSSFRLIENAFGPSIYGKDQDTMESVLGDLLLKNGKFFSAAESCTGGLISHLITSIAGSSSYYLGGITSYANSMKSSFLGVKETLLQEYGAVSHEVAEAMAEGMRRTSRSDIAISVTGVAGPDGGSSEKPVGTVFVGMATEDGTEVRRFLFSGSRHEIQHMTAQTALDLVRRSLLDNN
ncbi:MAG: CinA family nicotinamide mononucleotide deamidase-related protein [Thermodesulfobacteriota bacterium]